RGGLRNQRSHRWASTGKGRGKKKSRGRRRARILGAVKKRHRLRGPRRRLSRNIMGKPRGRAQGGAELTAKVVHCNGYSLAEEPKISREKLQCLSADGTHCDWEYVCWGDPTIGALGRIPMTLWLARHVDANLIIWSTGSSRRL